MRVLGVSPCPSGFRVWGLGFRVKGLGLRGLGVTGFREPKVFPEGGDDLAERFLAGGDIKPVLRDVAGLGLRARGLRVYG